MVSSSRSEPAAERRRSRRRWPVRLLAALALLLAAVGGFAAAVRGGWLGGSVRPDAEALVTLELPVLGGGVASLKVEGANGQPVAVRDSGGRLWPRDRLAQGVQISVDVRFSRPGLLGRLFGGGGTAHLTLVTPETHVVGRSLRFAAGEPISFRFSEAVRVAELRIGGHRLRRVFATPRASVAAGARAAGSSLAGQAVVAAAPRAWEQLSAPARVWWFPRGAGPIVQVEPRPGGTLHPWQQLRLTFSQPPAKLFGGRLPRMAPATRGQWQQVDRRTLVFRPGVRGFPLAGTVSMTLPAAVQIVTGTGTRAGTQLRWQVVPGTTLRLQQLLASLAYLPLDWQPARASTHSTAATQLRDALHPPAGDFSWRYPDVPKQLAALWHPGRPNLLTRAAVLAFQSQHGLAQTGAADADLWKALLADAAAGKSTTSNGYSYVLVSLTTPQTLSLWHDGQILIRSRVNAGTEAAPIRTGSYPIERRALEQASAGAGRPIRWISYFGGGDSLHSSNRRSYGRPQSSDGIELPARSAYRLWPYTGIGTLVTVTR